MEVRFRKCFIFLVGLFFSLSSQGRNCDPDSTPVPAPPPAAEISCEKKQDRMFADGILNITIANGYYDSEGTVSDLLGGEYWFNLAIKTLTGDCPARFELTKIENHLGTAKEKEDAKKDRQLTSCGQKRTYRQACGFRYTKDPEVFTKTMVVSGKPSLVKLRVFTAALTHSDKDNKESHRRFVISKFCPTAEAVEKENCLKKYLPIQLSAAELNLRCQGKNRMIFQVCKSHYAKQAWKDAIRQGHEIVMYVGHARDGGGPSFEPPLVLENKHVNYPWYRKNQEGHKEEAEAFKEAVCNGKAPEIYSSLTCSSHLHFFKKGKFPEVSPSTAFILSQRTTFADEGVAAILSTIESALSKQCANEWNQNLRGASCAFGLFNF